MSAIDPIKPAFDAQITFLPVADLSASSAFYETALGFPLVVDQGSARIYRAVGGAFLGICQSEGALAADDRLILAFVADDVDAWHARLSAQGVATDGPPRANERYRIYHFFARDPDGYRIEIQRFMHPFP